MTIEEFLAGPKQLADVQLEVLRLAHCAVRALVKQDGYKLTRDEFILLAGATPAASASSSSPRPSPTCACPLEGPALHRGLEQKARLDQYVGEPAQRD
jgi:hypothetical protein